MLCNIPDGEFLSEIVLDILNGSMNTCYPIHWSYRLSVRGFVQYSSLVVYRFKTNSCTG